MIRHSIGAVITGGDFQGLGVLRTLARKGVPVLLLDSNHCIGRYSRYGHKFVKSPDPDDAETYRDFLIGLAKTENISGWVIFPNNDEAVYVVSRYKELLQQSYRIWTPCWDVIKNVYIKKETYRMASSNGIPIPAMYDAQSLTELLDLDLQYPLVMKPSIRSHFYNKTKIKGFRINNRQELIRVYGRVNAIIDHSEIIVQDFIPGGPRNLYSYCPFFKNGRIIAGIAGRRARQHPMDFGHASTYVELVDIPELRELAEKFLHSIHYNGIAEVEFMQDPRDHLYKLIEVNPRQWGWHTLAIAAGLDLPYIMFQDAIGEAVNLPDSIEAMKWVRLTTDLPTVALEILKRRMRIRDYIESMKGPMEFAVFSPQDPLPSLVELVLLPYLWRKKGF